MNEPKLGRPAKNRYPIRDENRRLSKEYRIWHSVKMRCSNPANASYRHYGALGIKVCARWSGAHGFSNFMDDLGSCPEGMWLERKDDKKDFKPSNCQWALTLKRPGACDSNSLRQKALRAGLPYATVYWRVKLYYWDEALALSTPVGKTMRGTWIKRKAKTQ